VSKKALSPSTADSIRSCPARWAIEQLLPRTTDPFGPAELGTATHQLFEDLFDRPAGERGLAAAAEILEELATKHPELEAPTDPDELARWKNEVHRRMIGLWDIEDPNAVTVVESEMHLKTSVFGIPFNGYIDRVDRMPDGSLKIVDYKAGQGKMKSENAKYGDAHGDQLRLYVEALKQSNPELAAEAAEVFYVFHKRSRTVDLSAKAMAGTQTRYEKSWDLLNGCTDSGKFAMKTSPLCGWCPAVTVCPSALSANKVPKVEMAEHGELLGIGTPVTISTKATSSNTESTNGAGQPESSPDELAAFLTDLDTGVESGYDPATDFDFDPVTDDAGGIDALTGLPVTNFDGIEPTHSPADPSDSPEPCVQCGAALTTTGICASCAEEVATGSGPPSEQENMPPSSVAENTTAITDGGVSMYEDKPWEETTGDGTLNLNSYAATAVFGIVELAVEALHAHDQKVSGKSVDALAETFATIVERAQAGLGGTPSMQAGSHTRLRGALRTSLETIPPPFGEDADEWELWVAKSENRVKAITKAAVRLWEGGDSNEKPWTVLAAPALRAVN
jgi:putative RecB family exonuclease